MTPVSPRSPRSPRSHAPRKGPPGMRISTPRQWRALQGLIACCDALALTLAFTLASLVYPMPSGILGAPWHALWPSIWPAFWLVGYVASWLALLATYRLYATEDLLDGLQQYTRIAQASATWLLALGLVSLLNGRAPASRLWLLTAWALGFVSLGLSRFLLRVALRRLRRGGYFRSRMLIIGAGEDGLAIAEHLANAPAHAIDVVGFLDEYTALGDSVGGLGEVLGEPLALATVARMVNATDAVIVPQAIGWESLQELAQGGAAQWGVRRLWLAPALQDLLTTGMEVRQRGSLPLLSVTGPRLTGMEAALKRGLDITLILVTLPLLLPLCLLITAWLAVTGAEPPIVTHRMIGRDRAPFRLITFAPTPTLQRLHLWRLPAFLNVLRGDLSLVGPRPVAQTRSREYRPWHLMLASMRPGLTGPWWLLSGSRDLSLETEVRLDLAYIRTYTIWSDLRTLALTARRLLTPGAVGNVTVTPDIVAVAASPESAHARPEGVERIGGLV